MKTRQKVLIGLSLVAVTSITGLGVVAGSHRGAIANALDCKSQGQTHYIDIKNNYVSPEDTYGKLCDKLVITNKDNVTREIAFGPHEQHVPYDGVSAKILGYNQSFTITMSSAGLYHLHDHFHDEASGFFTVSK